MQHGIASTTTSCRIYVRPEGNHFVGLCAEIREIVAGSTVDEIVSKVKQLVGDELHVTVHARGETSSG